MEEELKRRYKPKMESYVQLTEDADHEDRLKDIFDKLGRAPKQLELLMGFIQLNQRYSSQPKRVKR